MQLRLELLAPAKNKEIGIAAIDCGADAVYIAGPAFGAREAASNSFAEIKDLVEYAHRFGVKIYLALNTILYDTELKEAEFYIKEAYSAGCDAIIIQDLGIIKMDLPPIDLHASTQTNIRTPEQARWLESLGFKRLILARELSLDQIKAIRQATSCELEAFVHGALCVSYSGQCYMSQYLTGRSANRGRCIQACRSKYDLVDNNGNVLRKNLPLLSLKDLCLAPHIKEMAEAGITSFKIEGRLKSASYVKNIVRYYRNVIDNIPECEKTSIGKIYGGFTPNPVYTFNRGYTSFNINGVRDKWNSLNTTKSIGEYIGKVTKIITNDRRACIFAYDIPYSSIPNPYPLTNGDGLIIIPREPSKNTDTVTNDTELRIVPQNSTNNNAMSGTNGNELRTTPRSYINNDMSGPVGIRADVVNNSTITTKEIPFLQAGASIYRNNNIRFERDLEHNCPQRLMAAIVDIAITKETITISGRAENGKRVKNIYKNEEIAANNKNLVLTNLINQFNKTTAPFSFKIGTISVEGETPFLTFSRINTYRREIAEKLNNTSQQEQIYKTDAILSHNETSKEKSTAFEHIIPAQTTYLNCSNKLSRQLYLEHHIVPAPAYEINQTEEYRELMRTKYCIKFELGICPKHHKRCTQYEQLFLINQGKKLRLSFDCAHCEMTVSV